MENLATKDQISKCDTGSPAGGQEPQTVLYMPLLEPGDFRLLTIYPSTNFASEIRCALLHAIYRTAKYYAVSYVWGDSTTTKEIRVNGIVKQITENLESALRHLRQVDSDLTVWVDALCINQEDLQERNSQVQQMGSIYRNAVFVFAWLGEEAHNSSLAFSKLREWGQILLDQMLVSPTLLRQLEHPHSTLEVDMTYITRDMNDLFNEDIWTALVGLAQRQWWRRVWILQEFILGQDVVLWCGKDMLPWQYLISSQLAYYLPQLSRRKSQESSKLTNLFGDFYNSNIADLYWSRVYVQHRTQPFGSYQGDWVRMLPMASRRGASDPRDKIYGILGLMTGTGEPLIKVDYTKSLTEVYTMLSKALLLLPPEEDREGDDWKETPGKLVTLGGTAKDWFPSNSLEHLPTWADTWSAPQDGWHCFPLAGVSLFCASGQFIKNPVRFLDHDSMIVHGVVVDTISEIAEADETIEGVDFTSAKAWSLAMLYAEDLYPTGITRLEAFFRTILQDVTAAGRRLDRQLDVAYAYIAAFLLLMAHQMFGGRGDFSIGFSGLIQIAESLCSEEVHYVLGPFFGNNGLGFSPWPAGLNFKDALERGFDGFNTCIQRTRLLFKTEKGYLGSAMKGTKAGDLVCVLHGGNVPYILRGNDKGFILIGDAYLHGFMDGEAMDAVSANTLQQQDFIIH